MTQRPASRRLFAFTLGLLGLALPFMSIARADDDDEDDDKRTLAQKAAARFPQPIPVGRLVNRTVLEPTESQTVLGKVKAIVRNDDSLDAVIEYGGFLGFGRKPIAVPIDAMTLLGEYMEVVDFSPEELDAFPRYDLAGKTPLPLDEIIRVGLSKPSH